MLLVLDRARKFVTSVTFWTYFFTLTHNAIEYSITQLYEIVGMDGGRMF